LNKDEVCKEDIDFLEYIGGELLDLSNGYAEVAFEIKSYHKQHHGTVHGGAIATLADHTGWYAVISEIKSGYSSVTIELKVNYLKPAGGDILRAQAKVINRTKRTAFTTIEIFAKDILIAYATATYAIFQERENVNA
jgi:uncharacterized protein (TIGR00369 family)